MSKVSRSTRSPRLRPAGTWRALAYVILGLAAGLALVVALLGGYQHLAAPAPQVEAPTPGEADVIYGPTLPPQVGAQPKPAQTLIGADADSPNGASIVDWRDRVMDRWLWPFTSGIVVSLLGIVALSPFLRRRARTGGHHSSVPGQKPTSVEPRRLFVIVVDTSNWVGQATLGAFSGQLAAADRKGSQPGDARHDVDVGLVTFGPGGGKQERPRPSSDDRATIRRVGTVGARSVSQAVECALDMIARVRGDAPIDTANELPPRLVLLTTDASLGSSGRLADHLREAIAAAGVDFEEVRLGSAPVRDAGGTWPREATYLEAWMVDDYFDQLFEEIRIQSPPSATRQIAPQPRALPRARSVNGPWKVLGASVTGSSHLKIGRGCDDAHGYRLLPSGVLILAGADGAGSASRSAEGARCAVDAALDSVSGALRPAAGLPDQKQVKLLLRDALVAARAAVKKLAAQSASPVGATSSRPATLRDFATTLLLAVVTPDWTGVTQIGDGFVVVRNASGELETLTAPDRGTYVNETTFLTSADGLDRAQLIIRPGSAASAVALTTDGLQIMAFDSATKQAHRPFFDALFEFAVKPNASEVGLAEFLGSEQISARTDDDTTLVLAVRGEP